MTRNQLDYLINVTKREIKKKEHELAVMRPKGDQPESEYVKALNAKHKKLDFIKGVLRALTRQFPTPEIE